MSGATAFVPVTYVTTTQCGLLNLIPFVVVLLRCYSVPLRRTLVRLFGIVDTQHLFVPHAHHTYTTPTVRSRLRYTCCIYLPLWTILICCSTPLRCYVLRFYDCSHVTRIPFTVLTLHRCVLRSSCHDFSGGATLFACLHDSCVPAVPHGITLFDFDLFHSCVDAIYLGRSF